MAQNIPVTNIEVRYVIYSEARGVYLGRHDGKDVWSKDGGVSVETAPTFNYGVAIAKVAEFKSNGTAKLCQTYECWADKPGNQASKDAVANAGLPRW